MIIYCGFWELKKKGKKEKGNAFSVIFNIQVPILFDECSTALSDFSYKLYAAVKSTHVFCADVLFLDLDLDLGVIHKCKSLLCTLKMYVFWQMLSKIRCDVEILIFLQWIYLLALLRLKLFIGFFWCSVEEG